MKPSKPVALTQEEKAKKVALFLAQKREMFITSFAFGMAHDVGDKTPEQIVDYAVKVGDGLLEALYPKE